MDFNQNQVRLKKYENSWTQNLLFYVRAPLSLMEDPCWNNLLADIHKFELQSYMKPKITIYNIKMTLKSPSAMNLLTYPFYYTYEVYIKDFSHNSCFPLVLSSWLSSICILEMKIFFQQTPFVIHHKLHLDLYIEDIVVLPKQNFA